MSEKGNRQSLEGSSGHMETVAPQHGNPAALAERQFVACLMQLPLDQSLTASGIVSPEHLEDTQLRSAYRAIQSLLGEGIRPEAALIVPRMVDMGMSRQHSPIATRLVSDLLGEPAIVCNWRAYATEVITQATRRRICEGSERISQAAGSGTVANAIKVMQDEHEASQALYGRITGEGATA